MKRTTHILTLTTLVLTTIIITMVISPADAAKRYEIDSGDIAYVDVFQLIDHALSAEESESKRTEFTDQSNGMLEGLAQQLDGLTQQLASLEAELSGMQQSDPNGQAVYQQYQTVSQQYQTVKAQHDNTSQQISAAYQVLIANQLASAYTEIYAASNIIGAQEGFIFVFATRSTGDLIQTNTITGITQEILARPLMTPPSGVDITELVRIKLGYPEKLPEPEVTEEPVAEPEAGESTETPVETPAETPVIEDE